jgi:hypothetical protein
LNGGTTFDSEGICDVGCGIGSAVNKDVLGFRVFSVVAANVVSCDVDADVLDDVITVVGSGEGSVNFSEVTCVEGKCVDFSVVFGSGVFI